MSTKISTASRAHRTVRHLPQFQMAQDAVLPLLDSGLVLKPGEQFIGVYQNHPDKTNEAVVVTDTGLLIRSWGKWVRLNYDDMERVDIPEQKIRQRIYMCFVRIVAKESSCL
jgi:hypothetical protein